MLLGELIMTEEFEFACCQAAWEANIKLTAIGYHNAGFPCNDLLESGSQFGGTPESLLKVSQHTVSLRKGPPQAGLSNPMRCANLV